MFQLTQSTVGVYSPVSSTFLTLYYNYTSDLLSVLSWWSFSVSSLASLLDSSDVSADSIDCRCADILAWYSVWKCLSRSSSTCCRCNTDFSSAQLASRLSVSIDAAIQQRGVVVSGVGLINVVNPHWARLVLGWVTVCRRVNHLGRPM